MDAKTLAGLRPRDDSSAALRAALANVAAERAAAAQRRETAAANRLTAMGDLAATPKDIAAFEAHARDAELEIERLDLVTPDLRNRLAAATQRERADAHQEAIRQARAACAASVQALKAGLTEYTEAARVIARVFAAEKAQANAYRMFRAAVSASLPIGSQIHPHQYDPGIESVEASFLADVVLPGLPGEPMICGKPPKHPASWHYYANNPPGAYG